MTAALEGGE